MKKQIKKLKLAKDTVRDLSAGHLREVAGGTMGTPSCYTYYGENSCRICVDEPIGPP